MDSLVVLPLPLTKQGDSLVVLPLPLFDSVSLLPGEVKQRDSRVCCSVSGLSISAAISQTPAPLSFPLPLSRALQ